MALCSSVPAIHIFAVILGSLEIILFGGVIFGWHSVVYVYKDMGYFSNLCPADDTTLYSNNLSMTNVSVHPLMKATTASVPLINHQSSFSKNTNGAEGTISSSLATPRASNWTATALVSVVSTQRNSAWNGTGGAAVGYETATVPTTERNGEGFAPELSCAERLKIYAEDGVSAVCRAQDEQFNLIFSLATGINGMMSFPSGYLYDRLGTRISRVFSLVSFLVGQVCLIFASPSNPYLLYPGFIGLVYGGYQILLTNLQLSGLMPTLRSTIMTLYSGSYDTSASIFLIFKAAHEGGMSVNASFTVQAVFYFLIFASSTFLFLPKDRVPFPLIPGFRLRCYLCHKFGGHKGALGGKTCTQSSEWRIDPTGSVILSKFASRDALGDSKEGLKTGLNGDSPTEELSGSGAGDSLSPEEEKALRSATDDDDGEEVESQSKDYIVRSSALDGEATDSTYAMEIEILPANSRNQKTPSAQSKRHGGGGVAAAEAVGNEKGPNRGPPEGESMLKSGGGGAEVEVGAKKETKTFRQVVLSPLFLMDVMWISVQRMRSWIFVGMFNPWITQLACGDKALVSHYTSVYAALQFFGILTAPLSGRLMDRKIKGAEKYGNPRYERLHAAIASFVLNSTVSVLLTVCTLIPVLKLQYLTFVLHCLHRSFLYGPNSAFVANAFPNEHFGKLFGVTLTVSALFSMLQYPMFLVMQGPLAGDPLAINMFLLVLMLISYIHPIYIWRYLQKKLAKAST